MKICGICDTSLRDLRADGEKLVECVECGEMVCTATCSEVVTDDEGQDVYLCSECYLIALKSIVRTSRL